MSGIIKSLLTTLVIAAGLGFSAKQFLGFWEGFTLFTILQFIGFYFWNNKKITSTDAVVQKLTGDIDEILTRQEVVVTCPCGKNNIPVIVFVDEEPIITCDKCNNSFRVITEVRTQLVTEPVNMEQIFNQLKGTSVE